MLCIHKRKKGLLSGPQIQHFNTQCAILIISIPVPCIFYFVLWPTNEKLFHKLSPCYMFRHYRFILIELVNNKLKHLNCKLYYQQLHLKYLCKLTRYWLQPPWEWHDSVETWSSVIICEIIVHLLVIVQNKRCTVQRIEIITIAHCVLKCWICGPDKGPSYAYVYITYTVHV